MKRDMDLIRKILAETESLPYKSGNICRVEVDGYTPEQVSYHVEILAEANLVKATHLGRETIPHRLTWEGHEFLDASRNDTIWKKALEISKQAGGVAFEVMKSLLIQMAKDAVIGALRG